MRNVFEYFSENDYLAHHGILGQKWGVRRYQNKDGSYTEAGKERYGKTLAENVKKADGAGNALKTIYDVHRSLDTNKAVRRFEKTNTTGKELDKTHRKLAAVEGKINLEINKELEKKYGDSFINLPIEAQIAYYQDGKNMMKERASKGEYQELISKYNDLSKAYEKESRDFLGDLLGKYGDEELQSNWAIKYNFVTKEIGKQTVQDLAAVEMLRRAGGRI